MGGNGKREGRKEGSEVMEEWRSLGLKELRSEVMEEWRNGGNGGNGGLEVMEVMEVMENS